MDDIAGRSRLRALVDRAPVGLFVTDPKGASTFVNDRWTQLTGLTAEQARGDGWVSALHPDERDRILAEWRAAVSEGRDFAIIHRLRKPGGEELWVDARAVAIRGGAGEVVEYLGSILDITDRKLAEDARRRAHEEAERAASRLARLQTVTAELAKAVDVDRIAEVVVDHGVAAVGAMTGAAYLFDEGAADARILRAFQQPAEVVARFARIPVDAGTPLGEALVSGRPVLLESREEYARRFPESEARTRDVTHAPIAVAVLPLLVEGKAVGGLTLSFAGSRRFEPEERSFLELFAHHASEALVRTRLLDRERAARRSAEAAAARLATLAEVSRSFSAAQHGIVMVLEALADSVLRALGDVCAILLLAPDGSSLLPKVLRARDPELQASAVRALERLPVRLGVAAPGRVAETGEALRIAVVPQDRYSNAPPEYREHIQRFPVHSLLIVPIRTRGEILGVVAVSRSTPGNPYTADDEALLQDIADRAGMAIAHANAYAAERAARERLTRLQTLTGALASAMTREDVARLTVEEGCLTMGAATGLLYVAGPDAHLRLAASKGVPEDFLASVRDIALDGPLPGAHVARTREPVWIEDMDQYAAAFPEMAARAREAGRAPAFAAIPLLAEGDCIGLLVFGYMHPQPFSEPDRVFATMLAYHSAQALHRAQLLEAAANAARRAEEASRLKDEFLAVVSHEVRTPLSAIVGWAAILRERAHDPDAVARGVAVIERNARMQTRIVEDILDVSRVITGKLVLDPRPTSLVGVVNEALESVKASALAKEISLAFAPDGDPHAVVGDPERLRQIVWNLLSNAIKFTGRGGRVGVELERTASAVRLSVSDTGQGIDPAFLPHVFERFRQADSTAAREHGGLGLGLAIVRHLVELHGGHVEARSEGRGEGATFIVTFPVTALAAVPTAEPSSASAHRPPSPAGAGAAAALAGARVLVVDDEPDARDLVATMLASLGVEVRCAASAAEGLLAITAFAPDVLVSDIGMPAVDGYAFLRRVRKLPAPAREIPAIALTAFARDDDARKALDAGFQAYLSKPVEPEHLAAAIAAARAARRGR